MAKSLLELYDEHRHEIDALTDDAALFALFFLSESGRTRATDLQRELNLQPAQFGRMMNKLARAGFLAVEADAVFATATGKQFLLDLGFAGGAASPPESPREPPQTPPPSSAPPLPPVIAGAAPLSGFFSVGLVLTVVAAMVAGVWFAQQIIAPPTPTIPSSPRFGTAGVRVGQPLTTPMLPNLPNSPQLGQRSHMRSAPSQNLPHRERWLEIAPLDGASDLRHLIDGTSSRDWMWCADCFVLCYNWNGRRFV